MAHRREQFKVWVHIERITADEDQHGEDEYEDVDLPDELGCFDTLQEAEDFATRLGFYADVPTPEEMADTPSVPYYPPTYYPRLWLDVAKDRGVKVEADGSITGGALADVGIAILNGCAHCGATVSVGNSYQVAPDSAWSYCRDCAKVEAEPEPVGA